MIDEVAVQKLLSEVVKDEAPMSWDVDFDFRKNNLDSLDIVTLALKLEDLVGIRIPDANIEELRSINSVLNAVRALQS